MTQADKDKAIGQLKTEINTRKDKIRAIKTDKIGPLRDEIDERKAKITELKAATVEEPVEPAAE